MTESRGNWLLTGLTGEMEGKEIPLAGEETRLGRTDDNDIPLPEKNVSRHHLSIFPREDGCWIKDMGSKNGTFINEKRIDEALLCENDVLRVSEFRFRLASDEASGAEPAPAEKPRPGKNRIALYAAAAVLLAAVFGSAYLKDFFRRKPVPKDDAASSVKRTAPLEATDEEVSAWEARADGALQFNDQAAAVALLRKITAARPQNTRARFQLARAEALLKTQIADHDQRGAHEFEKLYYERAIREWRTVMALANHFDDDTYRKAQGKIREAEEKLARRGR